MTITINETSLLEDLDFDLEDHCEHEEHHVWHLPDGPAVMFVRRLDCPYCGYDNLGRQKIIMLCQGGWDMAGAGALQCPACKTPDVREVFWRYLGPLHP